MNKIHLKKRYKFFNKKKLKKKDILFITLISIIITVSICFYFINKKITPILITYAEKKATSLATLMITESVNKNVFNDMDINNLFIENKDADGNVISIDFDPVTVNTILNKITIYVENYLEKLESGSIDDLELSSTILNSYDLEKLKKGIIYEIPSGIVFNNALVSNLGPKIPVRINLNGDVITDINTDISSYGINNALIKVTVNVKVYMQVIIPFRSKEVEVETNIPVIMKIVKGEVLSYYYPFSNPESAN